MRLHEIKTLVETDRTPLSNALSNLGINFRLNLTDIDATDVSPSLKHVVEKHIVAAPTTSGLSDGEIAELQKFIRGKDDKVEEIHAQFMNLNKVFNRLTDEFRNGIKDFPATTELAGAALGRKVKDARDWFNSIEQNIERIYANREPQVREKMTAMHNLIVSAVMRVSVGESWTQRNVADFKNALVKFAESDTKDPTALIANVETYLAVIQQMRMNTQVVLKSIEEKLRKK